MIEIYTDGACIGNPGPGGWAAIVVSDAETRWTAGRVDRSTNNRMELMGAIKGLEMAPTGSQATLYSDSEYLINSMKGNWRRQRNLDLWDALDALAGERRVTWEWVRGHSGFPLNEEADRLAREAAQDPRWGPRRTGSLAIDGLVLGSGEGPVPSSIEGIAGMKVEGRLSHLDDSGNAQMVDVSPKDDTHRVAVARGRVVMLPSTLALIKSGSAEKGDVLTVAKIAGIMAAKHTPDLIPMCHPLLLTHVQVELELNEPISSVEIEATVRTTGKTGVEMEALTAVMVAALTVYDMCKAVDRGMRIEDVRLALKEGGASGSIVLE